MAERDPDPWRDIRTMQERIRTQLSPAVKIMEDQGWRIAAIMDHPAIRQMQEHQRRVGEVSERPLWQLLDQQERITSFIESGGFRAPRELLVQWEASGSALSPPIISQIESYPADLANRVLAAEDIAAPSWSVLVWEIEGNAEVAEGNYRRDDRQQE